VVFNMLFSSEHGEKCRLFTSTCFRRLGSLSRTLTELGMSERGLRKPNHCYDWMMASLCGPGPGWARWAARLEEQQHVLQGV
jgi:hypothetical protein